MKFMKIYENEYPAHRSRMRLHAPIWIGGKIILIFRVGLINKCSSNCKGERCKLLVVCQEGDVFGTATTQRELGEVHSVVGISRMHS